MSYGLSLGLVCWLLLGLYQGIESRRIDDQDRRVFNQGIHRSMRNSAIIGGIGGGMIGIISLLSTRLNDTLLYVMSHYVSSGVYIEIDGWIDLASLIGTSITGAAVIFLLTGGLATLRHTIIRFLLAQSNTFPWRALHFLNDATARILLRRIGGGYSFTHRLLLDYFANLD